jgi:steroid delta-isomerase-like uncharacterized protein
MVAVSTDNKAVIRRFLEEYLNGHNVAVADELLGPGYVNHLLPPGTPAGQGGEQALFYMFYGAFPDFSITINDLVAEGDKVAARWTFHGTNTGEFQGMPPTGRKASFDATNVFRLSGGKIVENWPIMDQMGLMQQLGVVPTPGQ